MQVYFLSLYSNSIHFFYVLFYFKTFFLKTETHIHYSCRPEHLQEHHYHYLLALQLGFLGRPQGNSIVEAPFPTMPKLPSRMSPGDLPGLLYSYLFL